MLPNLNICLSLSLSMQRSQVTLLKTHEGNKIKSSSQEIMMNNPLTRSITELEYHLEEGSKSTTERLNWHNPKNKPYLFELLFTTYDLNVALRMFTRHIVIQRRVEDLQLSVESYQKKLNLTKHDTYRPNLMNKTAYTSHSYTYGIIYVDQFKRKRLIGTDELHKFNDGTLNDVRTALYDIDAGIRMEYLPMRK
ncbi:hypothetical protein Tco_1548781 [Tanacetum coccineum]